MNNVSRTRGISVTRNMRNRLETDNQQAAVVWTARGDLYLRHRSWGSAFAHVELTRAAGIAMSLCRYSSARHTHLKQALRCGCVFEQRTLFLCLRDELACLSQHVADTDTGQRRGEHAAARECKGPRRFGLHGGHGGTNQQPLAWRWQGAPLA